MPRIDDGPTDGPPGRKIRTACVTLTSSEALQLLGALSLSAEEAADDQVNRGWHAHLSAEDGRELTVAIDVQADEGLTAQRFGFRVG